MRTIPVSVIVMTKNEEKNLEKCLRCLGGFSEIFVVDSNSRDRTCEIAKKYGTKVVNFTWNGQYPKKKQWCLDNLPFINNWVLYVDADEEVPQTLTNEIASLKLGHDQKISGYYIGLKYVFMGKTLNYGHRIHKLILLNRFEAKFVEQDDLDAVNMWEVEGHYQPNLSGKAGKLKNKIIHNEFDDLFHFFDRHNRYSDWEATITLKGGIKDRSQLGINVYLKQIFNKLPFKWLLAFFYNYFLKFGILDGKQGFHYALYLMFLYWQIDLKIYEKKLKNLNG